MEVHGNTILEYATPDKSISMLAIFTTSPSEASEFTIIPRGISREKSYYVRFDNSGETVMISGNELIQNGISFSIGSSMSSELIVISTEKPCI